jgi:tetratricopeptide (TPR) repeat protein
MYEGLGRALYTNRLYLQAEAAFRTGLDLEPAAASLHYWMGDVSWRLNERERAAAELDEAVRLDPGHAPAYVRLASVRYYLGDHAGAWRAVHAAEDLGASLPSALRGHLAAQMPEPVR